MSMLTLSRTEAKTLTLAAEQPGGQIVLPANLKPMTAQRLMAKLLKHALVVAGDRCGEAGHHLTPAGYRSVALELPVVPSADASVSKRDQVVSLLRRSEGASVAELVALTGWLPHATRAALSRLRSAGQPLVKSTREDGSTAYRIIAAEPDKLKSRPRAVGRKRANARVAADAGASAGATAA